MQTHHAGDTYSGQPPWCVRCSGPYPRGPSKTTLCLAIMMSAGVSPFLFVWVRSAPLSFSSCRMSTPNAPRKWRETIRAEQHMHHLISHTNMHTNTALLKTPNPQNPTECAESDCHSLLASAANNAAVTLFYRMQRQAVNTYT